MTLRAGFLGFDQQAAHLPHRVDDRLARLVRRQQRQALSAGEFDIDADPVGIAPGQGDQQRIGPRHQFQVDIAVEALHLAQPLRHGDQLLHGVVGRADHAGAEEQPFDVVAAVEVHGQVNDFVRRHGGAGDIVGAAVETVGAVVDAGVGEEDFQQRDAAAIGGPGMADAAGRGTAESARLAGAVAAAGGAGNIVLGAVGQDFQALFKRKGDHGGEGSTGV